MSADDIRDTRFVTSMFPLVATEGSVGFDSIERSEVRKIINSHLKMVLLTNPGEIISDPKFGVGLFHHLFLLENESAILNLKTRIEQQIRKYLPYLALFRVAIDSTKIVENKLAIRIGYTITNTLSEDTVDFIITESSAVTIEDPSSGPSMITVADILSERV